MANSSAASSTFATVESKDPKQKTLVGGFTTSKVDPIPSMANSSAASSTFARVQPQDTHLPGNKFSNSM